MNKAIADACNGIVWLDDKQIVDCETGMTLESWEYGDPEAVAIRRQKEANRKEIACGQCRERSTAQWQGQTLVFCGLKRQTYGRRCEHFRKKINWEVK